MLVPSTKLLGLTALVVLPCATLAGVLPATAPLAVGVIAASALAVAFDALRGLGVLDGLGVTLPGIIRLSKGRPGKLTVQLRNDTGRGLVLRLGLALPAAMTTPEETFDVRLPADAKLATFDWPLTALERGTHRLPSAHLEAKSPFGLWDMRRALPTACDVRVYPDLLGERRAIAAVFLNRGAAGAHAQRQIGKGREFQKLRDYLPGDAVDDIHWKATAKRGRPVTKVFQVERTQEVYVILDASRLSARDAGGGSGFRVQSSKSKVSEPQSRAESAADFGNFEPGTLAPEPILERCLKAALILGAAAERQGDLFGVVAFDDRVRRFVRARNGRAHYAACRDALHTLRSKPVTPDFEELCSFLRLRLRRRALLVFLTSLDDPVLSESFLRGVDLIARQHLVLVVQPRPPGAQALFQNPDVSAIDDVYAEFGGHLRWQRLRALGQVLRRHNVGFTLADHDTLAAEVVRRYLDVKRRQTL